MKRYMIPVIAAAVMTIASAAVSAEGFSAELTATPKSDEVKVGDKIEVTVRAENTGDTLTDAKIYFEDQEIWSDDVFEPGEVGEKGIGLLAWESDIDSGGAINVSLDTNELDEPVKVTVNVTVLPGKEPVVDENGQPVTDPAESSPSTGNSAPYAAAFLAFTSAAVLIKKK
ncbi:MAG: hypothetical protein IKR73_02420 [Oscillospiraceae bacterium]|nr:hypothetical protein [Oscillospiraceae bacterium]